jgi:phosphate transport system permease protein
MTDIANTGTRVIDVSSDEAKSRIKQRYRAEFRFKLYGLAAVSVAGLFLVFLLTDIFIKALPSFSTHNLVMDVPLAAETIDPQGSGKPDVFMPQADFAKVARDALYARFPDITDRTGRRNLQSILSTGAADAVRRLVADDPSLIGKSVKAPILLSDEADLYLQGLISHTVTERGQGTATPSGQTGTVTVFSTSNAFSEDLLFAKNALRALADQARRTTERARLELASATTILAQANDLLAAAKASGDAARLQLAEAGVAKATENRDSYERQVAEGTQKAAELQRRYDTVGKSEVLDTTLPSLLVRINGGVIKATSVGGDRVEGEVIVPLKSTADAAPGTWDKLVIETPEGNRKITDTQVAYLEQLKAAGVVQRGFNTQFFVGGDSREPELAGILGALVGSALTMLVTLVICLPIGVAAAIYLEEFAAKNRWTELIEVNINNLAAVPSIVFGLLGLAVFLNFFDMPRSAPLVGGLVLALLVLPTIIIASRAALKAVPPSIREAALGVGASKQQAVFHHVLPLAMPGIMTGTIIGMAHALGETAPLLMIGMVAFIVDIPNGITTAATVLPVQIYLWSDLPELAFQAKTAGAIVVLLLFLFVMNGMAIFLRRRFERRW